MQLINETSLPIFLNDLLNKREWEVEYGTCIKKVTVIVKPLTDWKVTVRWLHGKKPYRGFCSPKDKLILIALNPKNRYPFTTEILIGTEQINSNLYTYKCETVTFNNPNELARFIFLHEFSHLLDYVRGFSLRMKQTKANRFALANWKGEKP
jgi:hypothetical protein